ncbi:MAG: hypothetical protein IAF58_10975, partial [Leptolyngbya sp.]|nr:hypothetical protein [Candidatus Melainabacteria bacterium]
MRPTNQSSNFSLTGLQEMVSEHEANKDFSLAFDIQTRIVTLLESEPGSVSGDLGDAFFHLGCLAYQLSKNEEALGYLVKALGFRRIFFGKGHEKVEQVMDLIKEVRSKIPKNAATKVDRRTAEYRRSQIAQTSEVSENL